MFFRSKRENLCSLDVMKKMWQQFSEDMDNYAYDEEGSLSVILSTPQETHDFFDLAHKLVSKKGGTVVQEKFGVKLSGESGKLLEKFIKEKQADYFHRPVMQKKKPSGRDQQEQRTETEKKYKLVMDQLKQKMEAEMKGDAIEQDWILEEMRETAQKDEQEKDEEVALAVGKEILKSKHASVVALEEEEEEEEAEDIGQDLLPGQEIPKSESDEKDTSWYCRIM